MSDTSELRKRIVDLENTIIELLRHCAEIEEPGVVADAAYATLMRNKITIAEPFEGSFNE